MLWVPGPGPGLEVSSLTRHILIDVGLPARVRIKPPVAGVGRAFQDIRQVPAGGGESDADHVLSSGTWVDDLARLIE